MSGLERLLILGCLFALPAAAAEKEAAWEGKTVRQWTEQLADEDVRTRWYAVYALGEIGPGAGDAVAPLAKILENQYEQEHVRGGAAWALGRVGSAAESVMPLLVATLPSKHVSVRRNSTRTLGNLGPAAKAAVPGLVKALEDDDATVRAHAAVALWQIDQNAKALPALTAMLGRTKGPDAYEAATNLGRLGADGEPAVPALVMALNHANADVRRAAARSLAEIGSKAVPALVKALEASEPDVRRGAVESLAWRGEKAVPELSAAMKNSDAAVRRAAARALGRLGPAAASAEAALVEAVNDADGDVRTAAAAALKQVQKPAGAP